MKLYNAIRNSIRNELNKDAVRLRFKFNAMKAELGTAGWIPTDVLRAERDAWKARAERAEATVKDELDREGITALMAELTKAQGERDTARLELSRAAMLINTAGSIDHRIHVLMQEFSDALATAEAERDGLIRVIHRYQPGGNPPLGGPELLAEWVLSTLRNYITELEADCDALEIRVKELDFENHRFLDIIQVQLGVIRDFVIPLQPDLPGIKALIELMEKVEKEVSREDFS